MAEIWLTVAAERAFKELESTSQDKAQAVIDAINEIPTKPGLRIDLPGAPPAEPFLAKEPADPSAPAVIYRRATPVENGSWLVVSLLNRDDYQAARKAEQELATAPPAVRELVHAAVAGSVSAVRYGTASPAPATGGAVPSTGTGTPQPAQ